MLIGISLALTQQRNRLGSSPVDPLAGLNWAARLQTHIPGSNTPLGLYQDVACTIPCTMDGDPVAAWRDELSASAVIATQSNSQLQPLLVFDTGIPTILFDGVDDFLASSTPTISQPNTHFVGISELAIGTKAITASDSGGFSNDQELFTTVTWNYYAGSAQSGGVVDTNWNVMSSIFNGASSSLRFNGSVISTGNPGTQNMIGIRLATGPDGGSTNNIQFTSALFSIGLVTDSIVETYLASLNP